VTLPLWADETGHADGPLVVLIHGSMDRSSGMARVARLLAGEARVLRYDRRGYARSRPHPGPFTMEAQVADLVGLLAGRRAVLVGHSYGGDVALTCAEHHPDLVRSALVFEPPLSWQPDWPGVTAGAAALAAAEGPDGIEDAAERFLRRMLGDRLWERLPASTRAERRSEGPALVGELIDLRSHQPWHAEAIACPVISACGSESQPHHRHAADWIAGRVNGAEYAEIHGARHGAHTSHPADLAALARLAIALASPGS
jgi:pimeloyl-ACP methyl ester carboxylesterase